MIKKAGWFKVGQSGSHVKYHHDDFDYPLIVPFHGSKEVGKGLVKKILKLAGVR